MKWRMRAFRDGRIPAVRAAEQIVGTAWMGELFDAARDSEAAWEACAQLRERALAVLRSAQIAGDPARIAESHAALEEAERDLAEVTATRKSVCDLLAKELTERPGTVRSPGVGGFGRVKDGS